MSHRRPMTQEEIIECCQCFWSADTNCRGRLTKSDFSTMLTSLGINMDSSQINSAFYSADNDKDRYISFKEFAKSFVTTKDKKAISSRQIKQILRENDHGNKGFLSRKECVDALRMLGCRVDTVRMGNLISRMNSNGDGRILLSSMCVFLGVSDDGSTDGYMSSSRRNPVVTDKYLSSSPPRNDHAVNDGWPAVKDYLTLPTARVPRRRIVSSEEVFRHTHKRSSSIGSIGSTGSFSSI